MKLDFIFFNEWARKNLNIDLDAYKENQLQRRITTVMKGAGAANLQQYASMISQDSNVKRDFLDYITINVTDFYRNREIFQEFKSILTDELAPKFQTIKIWSAACSIGAEPYTLAMILDGTNLLNRSKILATDIDEVVLDKAKKGIYSEYEIKNLDKSDLDKYFSKEKDGYHINNNMKNIVSFKKQDLILDRYETGFHAIVCRNVTIYLKDRTKDEIYRKMEESLVPGGVLFIGATETIHNPESFGFRKLSTFIYEKM